MFNLEVSGPFWGCTDLQMVERLLCAAYLTIWAQNRKINGHIVYACCAHVCLCDNKGKLTTGFW